MLRPFAGSADYGKTFWSKSPNQIITPNDEYQYLIKPFTIDVNMSYY